MVLETNGSLAYKPHNVCWYSGISDKYRFADRLPRPLGGGSVADYGGIFFLVLFKEGSSWAIWLHATHIHKRFEWVFQTRAEAAKVFDDLQGVCAKESVSIHSFLLDSAKG